MLINLPQKPQEAVSNVEITVVKWNQLDKSKISRIYYPYIARSFKFFIGKIKIDEGIDFLPLGVTNITWS